MEVFRTDQGQEERWFLVKMKDDQANAHRKLTRTERELVLSGPTLAEIKAEKEKQAAT